ncbi:hypothetical protein EP7_001818 [Isosphaeraceae bacterium EP7]
MAQYFPAMTAERERFLSLLMLRQDRAMELLLTRQKAQLQRQLDRLEKLIPRNPQQPAQIKLTEQRIGQRVQAVERTSANPPDSPVRTLLYQQKRALLRQVQQLEARLARLAQTVARNPRQARQIEQAMASLRVQLQRTTAQVATFDRLAATPAAPLNVASVFEGRL